MQNILIFKILSLAIIMGLGYVLVRFGPLTVQDSRSLSRLTVYLVMPCSIFSAFLMERTPQVVMGLGLVLLAALLIHLGMLALGSLLRRPLRLSPVALSSVLYTNGGNLIIPLVTAMLGPQWVIYTSAYIFTMTVLTWTHGNRLIQDTGSIAWKALLTNPNIWALALGLVFFFTGLRLPSLLEDTERSLGTLVGPLSMLVTGMLLGAMPIRQALGSGHLWITTALRLLVFPLLSLGLLKALCLVFPMGAPYFLVTMLSASAPSAALITHICQISGRDSGEASAICVVTTVLCVITIPLMAQLYQWACL